MDSLLKRFQIADFINKFYGQVIVHFNDSWVNVQTPPAVFTNYSRRQEDQWELKIGPETYHMELLWQARFQIWTLPL